MVFTRIENSTFNVELWGKKSLQQPVCPSCPQGWGPHSYEVGRELALPSPHLHVCEAPLGELWA